MTLLLVRSIFSSDGVGELMRRVVGEWNQFLYVSKIAFGGWLFHYRSFRFLLLGLDCVLTIAFCSAVLDHGPSLSHS